MEQVHTAPRHTSLPGRIGFFLAVLFLNSVIYQFALFMTFVEGMHMLGTGLCTLYVGVVGVAVYQRRLSLAAIGTQLTLTLAFMLLANDFARAPRVPVGIEYIKGYIGLLIVVTQFIAPARLVSRRWHRALLGVTVALFVVYLGIAGYAALREYQTAELAGGFTALQAGLGEALWQRIGWLSLAASLACVICLVFAYSRRGDWPADRPRRARPPQ